MHSLLYIWKNADIQNETLGTNSFHKQMYFKYSGASENIPTFSQFNLFKATPLIFFSHLHTKLHAAKRHTRHSIRSKHKPCRISSKSWTVMMVAQ
jgi:hypothetical protein